MPDLKSAAKKLGLDNVFYFLKRVYYFLASPFIHEYLNVNYDDEKKRLNDFSPKPQGKCSAENELIRPFEYDLQIIIPAYNAEKYLKECLDSVLEQKTDYKFIVMLIDDGSTDSTPDIAGSYSADPRVRVIRQQNRGFSGARNRGLERIKAKYVSFVDSDDVLPQGAIQALMKTAVEKDADIVEGGFYHLTGSEKKKQPHVDSLIQVNAEKSLRGQPWGKVYRSSLFASLHFPEGFWFEDSINSFLIFPMVKKAYRVPDYVYIYRIQPESITRTAPSKPKCVDTYWITEMLVSERKELGLPQNEDYYNKLLWQIMLNGKRVTKMPEDIQKNVFALNCSLVEKDLTAGSVCHKYRPLLKTLRKSDYGAYKLFCSTHK